MSTASEADKRPWSPSVDTDQTEIYEYLVAHPPELRIPDLHTIVEIAAAMVAHAPAATRETDRKRLLLLCQLIEFDRETHGGIDLRRALRRESIERFIGWTGATVTPGTAAAHASHLRRFGRLLHPADYPHPGAKRARPRVQPPYTQAEIRALYRTQISLTDEIAQRLLVVLDLATGVGARAGEMSELTGSSVRVVGRPLGEVVCVDLPTRRTGCVRTVPFLDPAKGSRIKAQARRVGPHGYLVEGFRKNCVNGVQREVHRRGVRIDLSAVRLRHAWIVAMAEQPIPTALLLQAADLGDSHTLHDLSGHMRGYSANCAAAWFQEVVA